MSENLIYRTTSDAALQWLKDYTKESERVHEEWNKVQAEITEFLGPVPGSDLRRLVSVRGKVVGAERSTEEWDAQLKDKNFFPHWREHSHYAVITPRRNTRIGKEWAAKLDTLPTVHIFQNVRQIGMMSNYFGNSMMFSPGLSQDKNDAGEVTAIYQMWGTLDAQDEVEGFMKEAPEVIWERIPLSQWHARKEALAAKGETE